MLLDNIKKCHSILDMIAENPDKNAKADWKYEEASLILKTRVICTTISMAGIERLDIQKGIVDYLIVDEACQAVEPSCLIPF